MRRYSSVECLSVDQHVPSSALGASSDLHNETVDYANQLL